MTLSDALETKYAQALESHARPPNWRNPRFDGTYDLIVAGAGPGGLAAAREAAMLGAKVALLERSLLGGDRLNVGCVPSKALIRTARCYAEIRDAEDYGGQEPHELHFQFSAAIARVHRIQARLSQADSAQRLRDAGIDLYFGDAKFSGPDCLEIAGQVLQFRKALIATGARAMIPPIPGLAESGFTTNETVFRWKECPARLLVIGGGPLGCEAAQAFARFGARVVIAQNDPMFLPKEERDAAQLLSDTLANEGIDIRLNTTVTAVRTEGSVKIVELACDGDRSMVAVDEILVGVGRAPNVEDLDLESAGVIYDPAAGIQVDDFLRTSNPRVYAAGDVCLETKFTHAAIASAQICVSNALLRGRRRLSALTIPWCTYTDPEIAHVGLYVREALQKNIPVRTFTVLMQDVDRAVTDGEDIGFVKIHIQEGSDRILGATVVARHAGEMINGISLAITANIGLIELSRVIHTYPTQAEAIKMAAEAFRRSRLTPWRRSLVSRWLRRLE
ncbi:MAG: mercuric reductase [Steroidobacteraceae bacterium]|jgi:pyruvate/2-oxoglutarate dehydrogenase complex dihydrolipoamide dehydrogenase (E3) component